MKKEKKICAVCGEKAAKRKENPTGWMHCQRCGDLLCDDCAVYGWDLLPRCEGCHDKHLKECDDCGGEIENSHCNYCDYC